MGLSIVKAEKFDEPILNIIGLTRLMTPMTESLLISALKEEGFLSYPKRERGGHPPVPVLLTETSLYLSSTK